MTSHKAKEQYMQELAAALGRHQERDSILFDYELHVSDLLQEAGDAQRTQAEWLLYITGRLGTPAEVAAQWQEELSVTQNKTLLHFLLLNLCFFLLGGVLTFVHFIHALPWVQHVWRVLTAMPTVLMLMYTLFWGLLGYEIGKSFGAGGRKLLLRAFFLSLTPNLTLMVLVVFHVIPHDWFWPLLTRTFIFICIAATACLYPICLLGYWWGKKHSL